MNFLRETPFRILTKFKKEASGLNIHVLEFVNCDINTESEITSIGLRGKIIVLATKSLRNLQLFLSNAHRISKANPTRLVKENNLPFGRTLIFDSLPGENILLQYEIDPNYIKPPLSVNISSETSNKNMFLSFAIKNDVESSSVMDNFLTNLQANISLPFQINEIKIEPQKEAKYVQELNAITWNPGKMGFHESKNLVVNIGTAEELQSSTTGTVSVKFGLPNRTLSQIFIEKIQSSRRLALEEIPASMTYQTIAENYQVKFDYIPTKPVKKPERPEIIVNKSAERNLICCGETVEIKVVATNIGKQAAKNVTIADTVPGGFQLLRGNNYWLGHLNPNERRELTYFVIPNFAGDYELPQAIVTYHDSEARKYENRSSSTKVTVQLTRNVTRTCNFCGASLPKGSVYCGKCGKRIQ